MVSSNPKGAAATNPWLAYHKPNPSARVRLFCFPYAGGGSHVFRAWSEGLPNTVEVCAIQSPGRGSRLMETPFTQMLPLAQNVAQVLLPHLDKPFAFFGHSMGAMVSFEVARQLRKQHGLQPICLFVSGCFAPQRPDPHPIHALPEAEFLEELRRLGGIPNEALESNELLQLMLPTLRADCTVSETYAYTSEAPFDFPISALGGLQDPLVGRDDLDGWREQTSASFTLRMLPGDHFFLQTARPLLLHILSRELHQLVR